MLAQAHAHAHVNTHTHTHVQIIAFWLLQARLGVLQTLESRLLAAERYCARLADTYTARTEDLAGVLTCLFCRLACSIAVFSLHCCDKGRPPMPMQLLAPRACLMQLHLP
eukprot:scaffold58716_cov19-Tisochrysis_lutea.AAC.1